MQFCVWLWPLELLDSKQAFWKAFLSCSKDDGEWEVNPGTRSWDYCFTNWKQPSLWEACQESSSNVGNSKNFAAELNSTKHNWTVLQSRTVIETFLGRLVSMYENIKNAMGRKNILALNSSRCGDSTAGRLFRRSTAATTVPDTVLTCPVSMVVYGSIQL